MSEQTTHQPADTLYMAFVAATQDEFGVDQPTRAAQILDEVAPHINALVAEAEKRGAEKATAETIMGGQRYAVVWALRRAAEDWRRNGLAWDDPDEETNTDLRVARSLDQRADRIQAGGDR